MKILVTGAAGHVASLGLPGICSGHDLTLTDLRAPAEMPDGARFRELNLLEAADGALVELMEGAEIVVHSAYIPSGQADVYSSMPPQIDRFEAEFGNIRMAQRIYRSAFEAGVRRVVVISSNHAADWYEHALVHHRVHETVQPHDYPLSDNFYGWAKASYELLAFPYACGTFGRRMEMISLRIGSPYPIDPSRYEPGAEPARTSLPRPSGAAAFKRALGAYLSGRDCAELFRAAVEAGDIADEHGVPWAIAYGISDNTRAFWSLESARRRLGYAPRDDSEIIYADAVRQLLVEPDSAGRLG